MKYDRVSIDGFTVKFELFDDALEALTDQQLGQVIRAARYFAEAEGNGEEFMQPDFDLQSKVAFNMLKRAIIYGNQARKQNKFTAKFNKDFSDVFQKDGEKVAPELIAKQFTDEQLSERGYTPEEIKMIHTRIENYEAKVKAREQMPTKKKGGKITTESQYDQRPNEEPDGHTIPEFIAKYRADHPDRTF